MRERVIANLRRRYYTEIVAAQRTIEEVKKEFLDALESQRQLADSQQDFVITKHDGPEEETKEQQPSPAYDPVKEQPAKPQSKAKKLRTFAMSGFGMVSRPKTAVPSGKVAVSEKQIDDIMGQGLGMTQNKLKLEDYDFG